MTASSKLSNTSPGFTRTRVLFVFSGICILCLGLVRYLVIHPGTFSQKYDIEAIKTESGNGKTSSLIAAAPNQIPLDTVAYDEKLAELANYGVPTTSSSKIRSESTTVSTTTSTATSTTSASSTAKISRPKPWPVKTIYPNAGALLPFNRIVAYYGNFYSTQMGVLGEYPPDQVLRMLASTTAEWTAADPSTPVIPAIDYIAVTAQGSPGSDGKYRFRMPPSQIEEAISLANQVHGLVFLDIQVGLSNLQTEIPLLEEYLKLPQVELSVDPEFAMQTRGGVPGTVIGTLDAEDINFTASYLATIVKANNLPPKILVVHRFTEDMVTHYKQIISLPEVEVVMDMDGWGEPDKKIATYNDFIAAEPVQFTGFKLFYKADLRPPSIRLLTPAEILKLKPRPSYIQYQ